MQYEYKIALSLRLQDLLYESKQDKLKLSREWLDNEKRWQKEKGKLLIKYKVPNVH